MAAERDPSLIRLLPLLRREWLHHPWRQALLVLAVALGVALAFSVQVINHSALSEFGSAVRSVNGEPDLSLRATSGTLPEAWLDRVALHPGVRQASPVVEVQTYALAADGQRLAVRVLGVDALQVTAVAPELLPQAAPGEDRLVIFDPAATFANASARERLALADGAIVRLQVGPTWQPLRLAGHVAAPGAPLLVMDVAAAQAQFGLTGQLTRLDLRLAPGQRTDELLRELALLAGLQAAAPDEAQQRLSSLSRAYRVNLTVLGLVALFVGGFLVFSVLSLSVAQRTPGLALLGVLGLTAGERRRLVLAECALLGTLGSVAGLVLGAGLAWLALRVLGGDLGGGYFPGVQPALRLDPTVAVVCAALGVLTALAGGWLPARRAERLAPAQALKGLGGDDDRPVSAWLGTGLLLAGGGLALLPPVGGVPLAAYAAVAALLFGGVALVPAVVQLMLQGRRRPTARQHHPLLLLALRRAAFQRATASAAVAGVVASLALSVALTVMVASFRDSVSAWLDGVLPADLYARSAASSSAADQAWFEADLLQAVATLPGVQRVQASRVRPLMLSPGRPSVVLLARPIDDAARQLPLQGPVLAASPGEIGVWVSEAMVALYGSRVGDRLELPLGGAGMPPLSVRVLGVWRDFARQFGSVVIDLATYQRLSGDRRLNELALWLSPGTDVAALQSTIHSRLADPSMLEFAATAELRSISLRIFDRSFAVTYYLQAVAITIGLVGIGASLSAQVLARRKEFGLLAHLGLTQRQVLAMVAGEGAAWLVAGTAIGLLLGLLVSVVLVHVVNPQSFHWTMELALPAGRLAALCAAVLATGIATAAFAARRALSRAAVLAVKEDW